MRRIAIVLILVAAVAGMYSCAADAPTAPKPGSGGGTPSSAVSVQLYTNNANPNAGTCTLIEALVALNGGTVPDGTSVTFSTDFGVFAQNGLGLVSIVTINGVAQTALCGSGAGQAKVKGQATIAGKTNSGSVTISFQASSATLPFVSFCNPSFGPAAGGTSLTLNGGRLGSTQRVQFTANGVTRDGIITAVAANGTSVTVQTPGFPELTAVSTPAAITMTLLAVPTSVVLSLPSCFAYGTADAGTPSIASILPSSGTNEGNTRVTIIGSGFSAAGVQVFFGSTEATVVSVSYNQVVVLSPPASGAGSANLNQTVQVTVKNIYSGVTSGGVSYSYTPAVKLTAIDNNVQPLGGPFIPLTIYGQGFHGPVAVTLAGWAASVISVSATEIHVIPGAALPSGCSDIKGDVSVVNIDTGDGASGLGFTYVTSKPTISGVSPQAGGGGTVVTITGSNLSNVDVKFGGESAIVQSASANSVTVLAPTSASAPPACTNGNANGTLQSVGVVDIVVTDRATTCTATASGIFQMQLPCIAPTPTPGP